MYKEIIKPDEIERRSMEIIEAELSLYGGAEHLSNTEKNIVKRVIHTTADFDYLKNLAFSDNAAEKGLDAIRNGAVFVTDTHMAESGISKPALKAFGCEVHCFMSDNDVAEKAKACGMTRASISMEKAADLFSNRKTIFAIGNAPTALIRLNELIKSGRINPSLIIGVPVGFVNVIEAKEIITDSGAPYIIARGRKGGSGVAAAICNALLYSLYNRKTGAVNA